jgi:hypothetical protein
VSGPIDRDDAKTAAAAAAILGAVFTLVAAITASGKAATSVAIGASIAVANLLTMRAIVRALLGASGDGRDKGEDPDGQAPTAEDSKQAGKRGGTAWAIFGLFKIVLLFGGIFLLLTRGWVDPIALVIGYGVLPLGIAASAIVPYLRPSTRSKRSRR